MSGLAASAIATFPKPAIAQAKPMVAIIGGGFGGASVARALRRLDANVDIKLIDPSPTYTACPFSNLVITGERSFESQIFNYDALKAAKVQYVRDRATAINPDTRKVSLQNGADIVYDKLILSPGIKLLQEKIEGLNQAKNVLHAWQGNDQMVQLRGQLEQLGDGGTVAISIPSPPFRCPPGPYERASLIACYLKKHKPRSKLLILDAQDRFSKQSLFEKVWQENYADIIERIPSSESGEVIRVDGQTLHTDFENFKVDIANVIPPQKAAEIARISGVTDATGWCPINAMTFESTLVPNIHIIGDATIANPMPKSAFSANQQAKICALQIVRRFNNLPPIPTVLANTCYSFFDPYHAFSVSGVYKNNGGVFASIADAGGTTSIDADATTLKAEAGQARDWYKTITNEAFGH